MINYFKELLSTLKSIDAQLKASDKKLALLSSCVKAEHAGNGAKTSISTKLWNDAR